MKYMIEYHCFPFKFIEILRTLMLFRRSIFLFILYKCSA